jgi:Tol biopolymer transport system component/predicted Ser/Thr protein kinase
MTLTPGTKLGPYEIIAPLGAGGMGEVYRARDTRLGREVAVKVLPGSLADNAQARERFEREARAVSKLNHPHICTLFDVGDEGTTHFLVMEYLEGETLAQRIERGTLPPDLALKYAEQTADALWKAHQAGIVHRDLKPSNIFLTTQGVKLLDFGLAKDRSLPAQQGEATQSKSPPALADSGTTAGTVLGTYPYMSPEQLEGKAVDSRCDIFAFGAVLYEMLTGQRAFGGKSQASIIAAILEREPQPISELKPACPRALDRFVRQCMAKDPEERWQSAFDLKLEIQGIVASPADANEKTAGGTAKKLLWVTGGIAAAAVLVALLIGARLTHKESPREPIFGSIVPPAGTYFQIEGDLGIPPALAPDGSAVIFGAGDAIWYRSLRDGTERMLSRAKNETYPFWSPDSKSIGFFSDGKLKTMDVNGGATKSLCDATNPRGGSWGSNGIILFTPTTRDVIYQIPATGGTPKPVTQLDLKLHTTHRWPFFLPDGEHFIYMAANHVQPQGEQNGVYIASLDGKLNRLFVSTPAAAEIGGGKILYVKGSELMVQTLDTKTLSLSGNPVAIAEDIVVDVGVWHATFSVSDADTLLFQTGVLTGMSRLEWVDRAGKHLSFASEAGAFFGPKLSKDGTRILVATGDPGADIWELDATGQKKTRLTFDRMSTSEAVWSPDETRFAYGLGLGGKRFTLNVKASSGSGEAKLLEETSDINSPTAWSPDGRYLLCERFENGDDQIWLVDLEGKEPSRAFSTSAGTTSILQSSGQFSPDGKWVAFTAATAGGPQTYVRPFPEGGGLWQASTEGGRWPRWRRDGKELYFVSDRNVMTAVSVHVDGEGLKFGAPQPLFSFRPALRIFRQGMIAYDVSPDGNKFLLNAAADENTRPLTLVINWSAELKQ